MTTGINTESSEVDVELNRMLDNLRFMCMGPDGLIVEKYEYYKEQILSMYSSEERVLESDDKESTPTVEQPSIPKVISDGPMDSAWSMLCHDIRHTGQSPYSTADNPYIMKWLFKCYEIESTPVIDNNGIIYITSSDQRLIAIYPDGYLKWEFNTDGLMFGSSPAIAEDGTIYIGSWDTGLYAINPDGTKKWRVGIGGSIASSPAIGNDGTIYVGTLSTGNSLVAVNPNGTIKWLYKTGDRVYSDPAIGDDGTIYIGSNDNYLYALNPDGTCKWSFKTGKEVGGRASIATDGTIYAYGTWDNYLYALYPNNGTVKWKCNIKVNSNPSIGSDGIIYVGGDEELYSVYPNGTRKWTFDLGNERWTAGTTPAISSDGTIYVSACHGTLAGGSIIAVNSDGTERFRKKIAKDWTHSSPSIDEDGTVYVGCAYMPSRGYLHAFGSQESNSPPDAPSISGETNGEPGKEYWYTCVAHDSDNNPLKLFVDWGDGDSGWVTHVDWWASGENMYAEHTYSSSGTYTIKAKVKDIFDEESDWGELTVTMPRDKSTDNMLFKLLERFPLIGRLLDVWRLNII